MGDVDDVRDTAGCNGFRDSYGNPIEIAPRVARIERLIGTDEGLFVVGAVAIAESIARDYSHEIANCERFGEKMNRFFWAIGKGDPATEMVPPLCKRLTSDHKRSNSVRHGFEQVTAEEARAATFNLVQFLDLLGCNGAEVRTLKETLDAWKNKIVPIEARRELKRLRAETERIRAENESLTQEALEAAEQRRQLEALQAKVDETEHELARLQRTTAERGAKGDELRRRLHEAKEERKALARKLADHAKVERYVNYLERFTSYTRSRADYERSVMQLSSEQQSAAARIHESGDYLVRGGAGTGKTLVLLHALDADLQRRDQELGTEVSGEVGLLTFTKTLVRFDRYLSSILGSHREKPQVATVDSFVLDRCRKLNDGFAFDYDEPKRTLKQRPVPFLSVDELVAEVEMVIFGRALTREQYVEAPAGRRGLRRKLNQEEREQVWEIAEDVRRLLVEERRPSRMLARLVLIERLTADESLRGKMAIDRLFVDEVQDLTPADLQALKLLARRGVVLAGDEAQSIYQAGGSFRRLGIDVVGRSTVLKTNYRNTRQIAELATEFLRAANPTGGSTDAYRVEEAFREGPAPEVWELPAGESMTERLVERVRFFVEVLGYDPESIAVLAPYVKLVTKLDAALRAAGFSTADVKLDEFDFAASPGVRLSTFHSAKGVEFPVVMLYLQPPTANRALEAADAARQKENLVYVAITRALDNLQVFVRQGEKSESVRTLLEAHRRVTAREGAEDDGEADDGAVDAAHDATERQSRE